MTRPSDEEIWFAIRYLDPDAEEKSCARDAIIALAAVVSILCATVCLLYTRGL